MSTMNSSPATNPADSTQRCVLAVIRLLPALALLLPGRLVGFVSCALTHRHLSAALEIVGTGPPLHVLSDEPKHLATLLLVQLVLRFGEVGVGETLLVDLGRRSRDNRPLSSGVGSCLARAAGRLWRSALTTATNTMSATHQPSSITSSILSAIWAGAERGWLDGGWGLRGQGSLGDGWTWDGGFCHGSGSYMSSCLTTRGTACAMNARLTLPGTAQRAGPPTASPSGLRGPSGRAFRRKNSCSRCQVICCM